MNRIYSAAVAGNVTSVSGAQKTLWLLNPAGSSIKIVEFGLGFDNVTTNLEPWRAILYRVQTLGSAAGTVGGSTVWDDALEATANGVLLNLTTEPSAINTLAHWLIQPNSGQLVVQYPLGREPTSKFGGGRLGLLVTNPSGTSASPGFATYVVWEE